MWQPPHNGQLFIVTAMRRPFLFGHFVGRGEDVGLAGVVFAFDPIRSSSLLLSFVVKVVVHRIPLVHFVIFSMRRRITPLAAAHPAKKACCSAAQSTSGFPLFL